MTQVKVSPKYQVVIPREVRERLQIKPGQKMLVIESGGMISLVPDVPMRSLMGSMKGLDWKDIREKADRNV